MKTLEEIYCESYLPKVHKRTIEERFEKVSISLVNAFYGLHSLEKTLKKSRLSPGTVGVIKTAINAIKPIFILLKIEIEMRYPETDLSEFGIQRQLNMISNYLGVAHLGLYQIKTYYENEGDEDMQTYVHSIDQLNKKVSLIFENIYSSLKDYK